MLDIAAEIVILNIRALISQGGVLIRTGLERY